MAVDIQYEWKRLMGRNALEIISWTIWFVKSYWQLTEERPADHKKLMDDYRRDAMSGDYGYLIGASAEFVRDQTGIELDSSYRLEHG